MKIFNIIKASWGSQDIRKRVLITVGIIIGFRLLAAVPIPGVDPTAIQQFYASDIGGALQFLNLFTGGTLDRISILSVVLVPFINASVIFQLLPTIIKKLENMQKEGEIGRKKITQYTRLLTVPLAILTSITIYISFSSSINGSTPILNITDPVRIVSIVSVLTAGSLFMMWMGEILTEKGIGNGISIIIMVGILSAIPSKFLGEVLKFTGWQQYALLAGATVLMILLSSTLVFMLKLAKDTRRWLIKFPMIVLTLGFTTALIVFFLIPTELGNFTKWTYLQKVAAEFLKIKEGVPLQLGLIMGGVIFIIGLIVLFNEATKNIPIYFSRKASTSAAVAKKSFMPLKLLQAGVMPIIFSSALLLFPYTLALIFTRFNVPVQWIQNASHSIIDFIQPEDWRYWSLNFLFTVFFAYFYTFVLFRPNQVSENLKKSGSYVPGIRPGLETEKFLTTTMLHLVFAGAIVLGIMSTSQAFVGGSGLIANNNGQTKTLLSTIFTSGTSLLITVGVVLDTRRQFRSYLAQRNYDTLVDDLDKLGGVNIAGEETNERKRFKILSRFIAPVRRVGKIFQRKPKV